MRRRNWKRKRSPVRTESGTTSANTSVRNLNRKFSSTPPIVTDYRTHVIVASLSAMSTKKKIYLPIVQGSLKPSDHLVGEFEVPYPAVADSPPARKRFWSEWLGMPTSTAGQPPTDGASHSALLDIGFPEFPHPHHLSPVIFALMSGNRKSRLIPIRRTQYVSDTRNSNNH